MKKLAATFLMGTLILTGCSADAGEELDGVLQDTHAAEQDYRDVQSQMEELEQQEQGIFESIMALTQDEREQVGTQVEEAVALVDERLELMQTEKDSVESAEEAFAEIDTVIEEADEEFKSDLTALKEKMNERFSAHHDFTAQYETLAGLQKELYQLLPDEETDIETLQQKTVEVNEQNTVTEEAVTVFNTHTEEFNEMKNSFIEKVEQSEE